MKRLLMPLRLPRSAPDLVSAYPLARWSIYLLTGYIGITAIYTLILGILFRMETGQLVFPGDKADPFYELGTSFGFWGSFYFCLNFILATRWRWVERIFDGLDSVYQIHNLVGKLTLTFVLLHGLILVLQALPDQGLLTTYLYPGVNVSYTVGVAGLILLTLLVIVTIWIKLPYHIWLETHKFMGIAYVLGNVHAIILQLDWYMVLLTLIGGYAWIYNLFFYRHRAPKATGQITQHTYKQNIHEFIIQLDREFPAQPGQFVFLSVQKSAQNLAAEQHPFSISGFPDRQAIRISAKILGDYTARLNRLQVDDTVTVFGPYGHFGAKYLATQKPMIWIAGGIGITPFLSMLQWEATQTDTSRPIQLIWSVKQAEEAIYLDEIMALKQQLLHFECHLHLSVEQGRLNLQTLVALLGEQHVRESAVFLCGPIPLMHNLTQQLRRHGLSRRDIIAEEFALR